MRISGGVLLQVQGPRQILLWSETDVEMEVMYENSQQPVQFSTTFSIMATTKISSPNPLATLQLEFHELQSWSASEGSDEVSPIFLAGQLVLGKVNVSYLNAFYHQPGDKVQVSLKGKLKKHF